MSSENQALIDLVRESTVPQQVAFGGNTYLSAPVFLPPSETLPTLVLNTLQGVIDFVLAEGLDLEPSFVHIVDEKRVDVYASPCGRPLVRPVILRASADMYAQKFPFGSAIPVEKMVVALNAQFVPSEDRDLLLRYLGNLDDASVKNFSDDGVTQTVSSRVRLAQVDKVQLPPEITLSPFRTFPDVPQPASRFTLRLTPGKGSDQPSAALFEGDGAAWKLDAIKSIKNFLVDGGITLPIIA